VSTGQSGEGFSQGMRTDSWCVPTLINRLEHPSVLRMSRHTGRNERGIVVEDAHARAVVRCARIFWSAPDTSTAGTWPTNTFPPFLRRLIRPESVAASRRTTPASTVQRRDVPLAKPAAFRIRGGSCSLPCRSNSMVAFMPAKITAAARLESSFAGGRIALSKRPSQED